MKEGSRQDVYEATKQDSSEDKIVGCSVYTERQRQRCDNADAPDQSIFGVTC